MIQWKKNEKKSFRSGRNRESSRRWCGRIHEKIWIVKKKKNIKKYPRKYITKKRRKTIQQKYQTAYENGDDVLKIKAIKFTKALGL